MTGSIVKVWKSVRHMRFTGHIPLLEHVVPQTNIRLLSMTVCSVICPVRLFFNMTQQEIAYAVGVQSQIFTIVN